MSTKGSMLERTLGECVRRVRLERKKSMQELASESGVSASMISRIENGQASPSLGTVNALANALQVAAASLLSERRQQTDVSYVKSGRGLSVERRGRGSGHRYQLLGHSPRSPVLLEPYLIILTDQTEEYEMLMHEGIEFVYVLVGKFVYRVGDREYPLGPGDSLCFDSGAPHGPVKLLDKPVRLLAVIGSAHGQ